MRISDWSSDVCSSDLEGIVLIAGGVGITPMMSVLRSLTDRSYEHDIYLLYGVNTPTDLIFREECDYLARRHHKLHIVSIVAKPEGTDWAGPSGYLKADFIADRKSTRLNYSH